MNAFGTPWTFNVDVATNRLSSRTIWNSTDSFSFDAAGNMTTMGTFDAENRLIQTAQGASYLYDGNGRRFRTNDGNVVNYVYSYTGQLLMEDRITESPSSNYIYFNGQVVAIHKQDDTIRLLIKDHLGSTRKVINVQCSPSMRPGIIMFNWSLTESYNYEPFGGSHSQAARPNNDSRARKEATAWIITVPGIYDGGNIRAAAIRHHALDLGGFSHVPHL